MLTKAWIAVLMGLLLGSLFLSTGCGWFGGGYSNNNPYTYGPCDCGAAHAGSVPAGTLPTASSPGGWRSVPANGGAPATGGTSVPAAGS